MATEYSITIFQGDEKTLSVIVKKDDVAQDISSLTGSELKFRVGRKGNEDMIEYTLTDSEMAIDAGTTGKVDITPSSADTALLIEGTYRWEVKIDDSGGIGVGVVATGPYVVRDSIMVEE